MDDIDQELSKIPPSERESLLKIGKAFGSTSALSQARATLNALSSYGDKLNGFTARQRTQLAWAAGALERAGAGRADSQAAKKSTNLALILAIREGKDRRLEARSVLESAVLDLRATGGSEEAVRSASVILESTASSGGNPDALATQLEQLGNELNVPAISGAVAEDGGPEASAGAKASAAALRALASTATMPRGTPAETQRLDLLDGLVVELVRQARRAARAAGRRLGDPALASTFELTSLYPPRGNAIVPVSPPAPSDPVSS